MSEGITPTLAELIALRASAQRRPPARRGRHSVTGPSASPLRGRGMEYAESRDVLLSYLDRTGLDYSRPEGAYFVMVDISPFGYASDVEFAHWMTKEIGVAPVPGSSFFAHGENRYVRLNFAKKPATLHAAGERLLKLKR